MVRGCPRPRPGLTADLLSPGVGPVSPEIFHAGGDAGQGQAAQQNYEDSSHVGDTEAGGFTPVTFLLNRIAGGR